jgi:hypothetical protein
MDMIWHEAVCENLNAFLASGMQKLLQGEINDIRLREAGLPLEGAESNGIPIEPRVVERLQALGMTGRHGERMSKGWAAAASMRVRLKPDATYEGHVRHNETL